MRDPSPFKRKLWSKRKTGKVLRFDAKLKRKRTRKSRWRKLGRGFRKTLVLALIFGASILLVRWQDTGEETWLSLGSDFALCGPGQWQRCVVDGDTLKIGQRRIRLTGYDAPEMDGACQRERVKAREAQSALRDWLNAAPYHLSGGAEPPRDKYGRELREARRDVTGTDRFLGKGYLSQHMMDIGLAEPYGWGGAPYDWCSA